MSLKATADADTNQLIDVGLSGTLADFHLAVERWIELVFLSPIGRFDGHARARNVPQSKSTNLARYPP